MKIVLVIDQFDDANNGTTISARRFAKALKDHGNEVRVIAIGKPADYKYAVRQMKFPRGASGDQSGNAAGHPQQARL